MKPLYKKLFACIPVILLLLATGCMNDRVRERENFVQDSLGLMEFKRDSETGKVFGLYHEGFQTPKLAFYVTTLEKHGIYNKGYERKLSRKSKMYNLISARVMRLKYGTYFLDSVKNACDSLYSVRHKNL